MAKRIILGRDDLVKLLLDAQFYADCPVFLALQEPARENYARYKPEGSCKSCGGDFAEMKPSVDALFYSLQDLKAQAPEQIAAFKAHLASRRGHAVGAVVVYYRWSKTQKAPAKLQL